jgi:hypothetical protein
MHLDNVRQREEQIMQQSGPSCACGRRSWWREPIRNPARREFRCIACHTVFSVPVELFKKTEADQHQQTA